MSGQHDDEDPADAALVRALSGPAPGEPDEATLSGEQLAEQTGVPEALLDALAREGLLAPREIDGATRYSAGDAEALRAGLALMEAGVPLDELLGLARRHDHAMRVIADEAVELFVRFVRDPIQGSAGSDEEAGEQLVAAFQRMLPASSALVAHHFRRLLLEAAEARAVTGRDTKHDTGGNTEDPGRDTEDTG
ncbi:hypothetical protein ER308_12780 [Egibacter rhizosphaerae]|uniref:HTH merR-type domain-containing protein n=1 Tax=Egibacter rhizosphaerae TaxID=1670831 RepID=A0A411YH00_9ACTN|nr:MerR family transcriptional regulator [Egibacter rhizosphaerae]QBI20352.1 hypothetical protein ER308_12780 [Egibacter rhizosphaerae]